jgi:hypothetical protein
MGTYAPNVLSWLHFQEAPHLVIKYEDLKADPAGNLRNMSKLFGKDVDEGKISQAVENASFKNMRAMEERERQQGIFPLMAEDARNSGRRFVNKASIHQSLAHFAPELEAEFDERFGEIMEILGYAPTGADSAAA